MYPLDPLLEGNFSFTPKQMFQHFLAVYDCFMNSEFVICCSVWITLSFIFFFFNLGQKHPSGWGKWGVHHRPNGKWAVSSSCLCLGKLKNLFCSPRYFFYVMSKL
jgi:hypothetical protein